MVELDVKWSTLFLTLITDKSLIEVNNITNATYNSGASKYIVSGTIVSTTDTERDYIKGIIIGAMYYNSDFLIKLPKEFIKQSQEGDEYTTASILSGANSTVLSTTSTFDSSLFNIGRNFNIENSDKLYTITNFEVSDNTLHFFPRVEKSIVSGSVVDIYTPQIKCILLNTDAVLKSIQGNTSYRSLELTFESY